MIKLIIFDLDGTLVDSVKDITAALNFALPGDGEYLTSFEVSKMIGGGVKALVQSAIKKCRVDMDEETCINEYLKYYSEHVVKYTVPYPGVVDTLEVLDGYKKAIVSNKIELFTVKVLERLDLIKYFDVILCADNFPETKPSPAPILHILDILSIKPSEAIIIGDTETDIKAGKAAKIKTVAAIYGYGKPGFQYEADATISDITQIHRIMRSMG